MKGGKSEPWTDEELGFIQDHIDWPHQDIANELGRSVGAVKQKRHRIRSGWIPTNARWTKAEDDFMLSNPWMDSGAVGRHLGRTATSVKGRRQWLKKTRGTAKIFGGNWSPIKIGARPLLAKTCPECGLLLQASWFGKGGHKYCVRCRFERTPRVKQQSSLETRAKTQAALQSITLPGATQSGQPWSESDFKVLADPDLTVLQKALTLHRTYSATQNACFRGGYRSKVGLGNPERDQWKINNPNLERLDEIKAIFPPPHNPMASEAPERTAPAWDWDDADLQAS